MSNNKGNTGAADGTARRAGGRGGHGGHTGCRRGLCASTTGGTAEGPKGHARKPAGKEGEAAGEAVEAQGAAHEEAATEQTLEEAEAERVAEAIRQAIEEQAREDENPHSTNYTLRQIIGGEMLQTGVMRKNVGLMAVVGLFLFVSVTNRYSVQEKLKEINRLEAKLKDAKYRALSTGSKYTEKTRLSFVLQALRNSKDSVLKIPDQPPYKIQVPEEGGQGE